MTLLTATVLTYLSIFLAKKDINFKVTEDIGNDIELVETAIVAVRSVPESAKIYIDGDLQDKITDTNISGIKKGKHTIEIEKEGYEKWSKEISITDDNLSLVHDITANLVTKGGSILPITNNGIGNFFISTDGQDIIYTDSTSVKKGLYKINLNNNPLNIFQTEKKLLLENTKKFTYSNIEDVQFSPQDDKFIFKLKNNYYVYDLDLSIFQTLSLIEKVRLLLEWEETKSTVNSKLLLNHGLIEKQEVANIVKEQLKWSPNAENFFYIQNKNRNNDEIVVYNLEKPLPVGEKIKNKITIPKNTYSVEWNSGSKRIILSSENTIRLIDKNGDNNTEIFKGNIMKKKAFSSPDGQKIIFKTGFKTDNIGNLYAVTIR